jgi:hypothetical protein
MAGDLLERWLESRLAGVPAELGAQVRTSLADREPADSAEQVASAFGEAALRGLDRVRAGQQSREDALHLLAADACLTYAFEAAADLGGDPAALAWRFGASGALGARIREAMAERSGSS